MRKSFFSLLLLAAVVYMSCTKDNTVTEQTIEATDLPVQALEYLSENFPDATITEAVALTNAGADYVVTLDSYDQVAFDRDGHPEGNGGQYRHHDGDGDGQGGHHGQGGNGGSGNGHGHHPIDGCGHHGDQVSIDSLPQAVTDYIAANYAGYTVKHAETDTLCSVGAVLEVVAFQDSTTRVKLFFDPSGSFLMRSERVDYTTTPQAVQDFIATSYAGYDVRSRAAKLTLADGSVQYIVFLKQGADRKRVFVKEDGTLVCEE